MKRELQRPPAVQKRDRFLERLGGREQLSNGRRIVEVGLDWIYTHNEGYVPVERLIDVEYTEGRENRPRYGRFA